MAGTGSDPTERGSGEEVEAERADLRPLDPGTEKDVLEEPPSVTGPVGRSGGVEHGSDPVWSGDQFKAIDDSIATLLTQLLKAVAGMFVAFAAARFVGDVLGLGDGPLDYVVEGLIFALFGAVAIFVTSARPIRTAISAQRRAISDHEATMRVEARRHEFTSSLQNALEMVEDEPEALDVVERALGAITASPAELLLADSSRAHLRTAVVSSKADAPGCGVESPWACPAVRRGQTLQFRSSEMLAACPHLRNRPTGPCSAVCVPVTVLGSPVGVIHVTGPDDATGEHEQVVALEGLAMQAGSRVGVIRAMARSEQQAGTDPLTGQLNRRSLDVTIRELREAGHGYAVAMVDLDHFKLLNDTYGHETGDRVLRLFAHTLRESVREADVVCRYGGEEFVVVFPRCSVVEAAAVVHRTRAALVQKISSGDVPTFTASFGLADSTSASAFDDVLRLSDAALLRAKDEGRDRLVIADERDSTEVVESAS